MQFVTVRTYMHTDNLFKIFHVCNNLVMEIGWEDVDWIALARDGYEWRAVVKSVECCSEISGGLL